MLPIITIKSAAPTIGLPGAEGNPLGTADFASFFTTLGLEGSGPDGAGTDGLQSAIASDPETAEALDPANVAGPGKFLPDALPDRQLPAVDLPEAYLRPAMQPVEPPSPGTVEIHPERQPVANARQRGDALHSLSEPQASLPQAIAAAPDGADQSAGVAPQPGLLVAKPERAQGATTASLTAELVRATKPADLSLRAIVAHQRAQAPAPARATPVASKAQAADTLTEDQPAPKQVRLVLAPLMDGTTAKTEARAQPVQPLLAERSTQSVQPALREAVATPAPMPAAVPASGESPTEPAVAKEAARLPANPTEMAPDNTPARPSRLSAPPREAAAADPAPTGDPASRVEPAIADLRSPGTASALPASQVAARGAVDGPTDFSTLVDRLAEAREAASPQTVRTTVRHADFGPVGLQFRAEQANLSVSMTSADPEFAPAVQAASAAAMAGNGNGSDNSQPGAQRQDAQSGSQAQAQAQMQPGSDNPANQSAHARAQAAQRERSGGGELSPNEPGAPKQGADQTNRDDGIYA